MKRATIEKLKKEASLRQPREPLSMPKAVDDGRKLVRVFVEGYEDVAFWRAIFDHFDNEYLRFEISVPNREDLPKGKKVLMSMIPHSNEELLLCVDSDFDYLFGDTTEQSKEINDAEFMFHTYTYATENYLCYAPSLHNLCVKATKNDTHIFDFEDFFAEYSKAIYPAFVWYAYSAQISTPNIFPLQNFKNTVRLGYLDTERNGADTIAWLRKQVGRRLQALEYEHPDIATRLGDFESLLHLRGVTPEQTYLFMHGHTLMDNVVSVVLSAVCHRLKNLSTTRIHNSDRTGLVLQNELSNYNNSLCNVRDALLFNENYKECFLYKKLQKDIENFLLTTR